MASRARLLLCALLLCGPVAQGQGCSQCRDTVSQVQPGVLASYRGAIAIMLAAAVVVGSAGVLVIRRFR